MEYSSTLPWKPTFSFNIIQEHIGGVIAPWITFLHLSYDVRHQIYEEAGLLLDNDLVLVPGGGRPVWFVDHANLICFCIYRLSDAHRLAFRLLQTCKAIHDEVQYILFNENRITVCYDYALFGLNHLSHLPPRICAGLRKVYIQLSLNSILERAPKELTPPVLKRPFTLSPSTVHAWRTTVAHLFAHTKPGTLDLHLICDDIDGKNIKVVLEALTSCPGILADCHVRLNDSKDHLLSAMARDAVLRSKGYDLDLQETPFRFLDLPPELRLRILAYTDLVAPYREVQWIPSKGFCVNWGMHYCQKLGLRGFFGRGAHIRQMWKFKTCQTQHSNITGSFCTATQSTYSSGCHCWTPPKSFMLVSRAMYEHSMQVLYSFNRVIILPSRHVWFDNLRFSDRNSRLFASRFITRHIWPATLKHLRTVELVFPAFATYGYSTRPGVPIYEDWRFAVDHLRAHADLPSMTVVVHMRSYFPPQCPYSWSSRSQRPFNLYLQDYADFLLRPHHAFLKPLTVLRKGGLERLFVFLEWDWHWSPPQGCPPHICIRHNMGLHEIVDDMEMELEQGVMGEEYDSGKVGKWQQCPSQWMVDIE